MAPLVVGMIRAYSIKFMANLTSKPKSPRLKSNLCLKICLGDQVELESDVLSILIVPHSPTSQYPHLSLSLHNH